MDLDRVIVEIRPRGRWEAMDLGIPLARACARPLWGAWVLVWLPAAALAWVALGDTPWLAALSLWWSKPIFDRVALHVLSRAVFGDSPRVAQTLRALPGALRHGSIAALTWMRFDAARSFNLALWQLEGLRGQRWRARQRTLEAAVRRPAGWLTATCAAFEGVMVTSLFALAMWMVPPQLLESLRDWWPGGDAGEQLYAATVYVSWVLAVAAVEPFYVASGFALYLNRRTLLEAWDLDIAFRRLASRVHGTERAAA